MLVRLDIKQMWSTKNSNQYYDKDIEWLRMYAFLIGVVFKIVNFVIESNY